MPQREPMTLLELLFAVEQCGGEGHAQVLTTINQPHHGDVGWLPYEAGIAVLVKQNRYDLWPVYDVRRKPDA